MSERRRLATPLTVKLSASTIVATGPSRVLTLKLWPSSFSIVPRTGVGGPAGGLCAPASIAARAISVVTNRITQRTSQFLPSLGAGWVGASFETPGARVPQDDVLFLSPS